MDFLHLSYKTEVSTSRKIWNNKYVSKFNNKVRMWSTAAYILSQAGAQKFVANAQIADLSIDLKICQMIANDQICGYFNREIIIDQKLTQEGVPAPESSIIRNM